MLNKIKFFLSALWAQVGDIWNRSKIFILALATTLVYLEWNKIKEAFATLAAQREMKKDNNKDQGLSNTENTDNNQANALVNQSNDLPNQDKPATDDWYKNQK